MARTKGSEKTGGRVAGVPNKDYKQAREIFNEIAIGRIDTAGKMLDKITEPKEWIDSFCKIAEYAFPKLARQEVSGPDGAPLLQSDQVDVEELANAVRAIIRQTKH